MSSIAIGTMQVSETPLNQTSAYCFPGYADYRKVRDLKVFIKQISKHVAKGGGVFFKFKEGAREGAIARVLNVDWSSFETVYNMLGKNYDSSAQIIQREWELGWDDRKNIVKWRIGSNCSQFEILFDAPGTIWKFERNADNTPKVQNFDHFGKEINIGDVCMFVHKHSKNDFRLRFGKLTRTSKVGTMWFKPFRTASYHRETEEDLLVSADLAKSVTILDDDVRRKVMMSKLAL